MNFYKGIVQYKGTRYQGWQVQKNAELTIQGQINRALATIAKTTEITTKGSGRTDAGVHALGQVVRMGLPLNIEGEHLRRGLNSLLPDDIRFLVVTKTTGDFCPIASAEWKEYRYIFTNRRDVGVLESELLGNYPHPLELAKLQDYCKILEGKHDFINYFCTGTPVKSTVRTIFEAKITIEKSPPGIPGLLIGDYFEFRIRGNGFLKQMVRLLVGAMWQVGSNRIEMDVFRHSLEAPFPKKLSAVAPPQGLYLYQVHYPPQFD